MDKIDEKIDGFWMDRKITQEKLMDRKIDEKQMDG